MINYDAGDFLQRWEVVKPLEALQQDEKTEHVVIGASAGLRNSRSASVGVNDCWSSLAVTMGLKHGYAVRSMDGTIPPHKSGGGILKRNTNNAEPPAQ